MGASSPEGRRYARVRALFAAAALLGAAPAVASAQVEARPVLGGTVYLADTLFTDATVILHHISDGAQGELDSMQVDDAGAFAFELPSAPDPGRGDIYFASVWRHEVLYFGPAITRVMDLDSLYEIHAYDTTHVGPDGPRVAMEGRSIFFEAQGPADWRVTDLFQLRNDTDRTLVAPDGGATWTYPLPPEARDVSAGDGETSFDVASFVDGEVVIRAALPPGERLFIARYSLDSPYIAFPTPGVTETLDILVGEPVPPLEIEGLAAMDRIELEAGSTFRRYSAETYSAPEVVLVAGEERAPPPVEWFAVILAIILAGAGLVAMRSRSLQPAVAGGGPDRRDLLVQVARLDEDFEALAEPTPKQRRTYRKRRDDLLGRLRADD